MLLVLDNILVKHVLHQAELRRVHAFLRVKEKFEQLSEGLLDLVFLAAIDLNWEVESRNVEFFQFHM